MGFAGTPQAKHPATGAGWDALDPPLRASGEIAVVRLANALSEALRLSADQLFTLSTHARTPMEREALLGASNFAQARRAQMTDTFRRNFEQAYLRACRHGPPAFSASVVDLKPSALRIIDHDVLEDALDPQDLVDAIQHVDWRALSELAVWFRQWLGTPQLAPRDLPLGPRLIGAAVSDAIRDQLWQLEPKQRLLQVLPRSLPERVGLLYRDLLGQMETLAATASVAQEQAGEIAIELPMSRGDASAETTTSPNAVANTSASPATIPPPASPASPVVPQAAVSLDTAAQDQAREEVMRHLAGTDLPRPVSEFLAGPWQALLAKLFVSHGRTSREWAAAVETMSGLIRILTPGKGSAQPKAPDLPALMQRLRLGLEILGTPMEERNRFFIGLAEYHGNVVAAARARLPAPLPPPAARPAAPQRQETPARQGVATMPVMSSEQADRMLQNLKTGLWMELREADGDVRTLKLAWISAQRSLFLCTDRHGARARSLGAQEFAALLREGRVRLVPPPDDVRTQDRTAPGQKRNA